MGLPELARLLLRKAPAGTIDAKTIKLLEATADGQPPRIWN